LLATAIAPIEIKRIITVRSMLLAFARRTRSNTAMREYEFRPAASPIGHGSPVTGKKFRPVTATFRASAHAAIIIER
jgi:hypothetical protein